MKILMIMPGFFPGKKYGGPPVSVDNFCSLMTGHEKYIITRNHDLGEGDPYKNISEGWNNRPNVNIKYVNDKEFNKHVFEEAIKEVKPDVIYLQSLFSASSTLPSLILGKKYHIPVVLAPRGELCKGAFDKKYKKLPYIWLLRILGLLKDVTIQSTSDEETCESAKYLHIDKSKIQLLTNIPSIPSKEAVHDIKQAGKLKLVFLSRIVSKKNLHSAIAYLKGLTGDVVFNIYGPKENPQYWMKCQELIDGLPSNINVNYCGLVSHSEVHDIFAHHDAFLFPTFSENYGHVIAEALQNGCIPIISDQTPWTDINQANAGWAISLDEENRFVSAINSLAQADEEQMINYRTNIKKYVELKMDLNALREEYTNFFIKSTH